MVFVLDYQHGFYGHITLDTTEEIPSVGQTMDYVDIGLVVSGPTQPEAQVRHHPPTSSLSGAPHTYLYFYPPRLHGETKHHWAVRFAGLGLLFSTSHSHSSVDKHDDVARSHVCYTPAAIRRSWK